MFDVGFTELLLLAIIGLLVLGPERLPKVARTLGGLSRKARSSWVNLKRSIDAEINAEEIKQPLKKAQENIRTAVDGVDKQLKNVTERANSSVSAVTSGGKAAAQPTRAASGATGAKPADAKPGSDESS